MAELGGAGAGSALVLWERSSDCGCPAADLEREPPRPPACAIARALLERSDRARRAAQGR